MNDEMELLLIVGAVVLFIMLTIATPLMLIYFVNVLVPVAAIPYTLKTWAAMLGLWAWFGLCRPGSKCKK